MIQSKLKYFALTLFLIVVIGTVAIVRTDSRSVAQENGDDLVTNPTPGGPGSYDVAVKEARTLTFIAASDEARRVIEYTAAYEAALASEPTAPAAPAAPAPTPPANPARPKPTHAAPAPATPAPAATGGVNAFLECVARYESGSNYSSHTANGSGGKYGALVSSWNNAYGVHYPYQATPAQQDAWAQNLYNQSGSRPWSSRGKCGG